MLIFVAHKKENNNENAQKITRDLQIKDLSNTYICSALLFPHLESSGIEEKAKIELCIDVLSNCDKIIFATNITEDIVWALDFANLVGMEVEFLEDTK